MKTRVQRPRIARGEAPSRPGPAIRSPERVPARRSGDGRGDWVAELERARRLPNFLPLVPTGRGTTVTDQRGGVQRDALPETGGGARYLVEDLEAPGPGQARKSEFLRFLEEQVSRMADKILSGIGGSAEDCPYIAKWFDFYADQDVAHVEASILRFAPEAAAAPNWQEYALRVRDRARRGFTQHVATGSLEGAPDDVDVAPSEMAQPPPPVSPATPPSLQRCWPSAEPDRQDERKPLLDQPSFDLGSELPRPDELVDVGDGWGRELSFPSDRWEVYTRVDDDRVQAIATIPERGGNFRTVVASSGLTHSGPKFTSFESFPPFGGLGKLVLEKLADKVAVSGLGDLYPSGPVPGARSFYAQMGMTPALKAQGAEVSSQRQESIKKGLRQMRQRFPGDREALDDPEVRGKLKEMQEWVRKAEMWGTSAAPLPDWARD